MRDEVQRGDGEIGVISNYRLWGDGYVQYYVVFKHPEEFRVNHEAYYPEDCLEIPGKKKGFIEEILELIKKHYEK